MTQSISLCVSAAIDQKAGEDHSMKQVGEKSQWPQNYSFRSAGRALLETQNSFSQGEFNSKRYLMCEWYFITSK